jgi:enamine deaminase RidA (YjgF/YER057c/UK114 family)
MTIAARLQAAGLTLPGAPRAGGSYTPVLVHDGLAHVAGQVAFRDGELIARGRLGDEIDVDTGVECARTCLVNVLAALVDALGDPELTRVSQVLKLTVFVASAPGFDQQPVVANGASELLVEVLGDRGRHARSAVGVAMLPLSTPVEIDAVVAVS